LKGCSAKIAHNRKSKHSDTAHLGDVSVSRFALKPQLFCEPQLRSRRPPAAFAAVLPAAAAARPAHAGPGHPAHGT
jgi:hypothetical protein